MMLLVPVYQAFIFGLVTINRASAASVAATTLFSWKTVQPAPLARFEAQGAVVNNKLYVIGGFYNSQIQATKSVDVYDLDSNTWQRIADIPEAITHAPVVVDGSTIYVLGGYVGDNPGGSTNHVWKLNTSTNTWSAGPNLPAGRGGAGAAMVGRKIYFYGGATRTAGQFNDTDRADHYVLNLDTGVWTTAAALPNPRNHLGGVALNGKVYALGGQHNRDEKSGNQTQVDVYDPASNTWSRAADLPHGRGHITSSVFTVNGRIMLVGGTLNGGDNGLASDDVLLYDPASNVWLDLPPIPGIRKTPVASISGNTLVVSTGAGYGATSNTWTAVFPETWEVAATMPTALGEVAGGIISNKLYLVGESNSATLAFDLSRGSWSSASALAQRPFTGHHHT
ncbi:MAG: hypothetical protein H0T53_14090, partial [Herpetosiphonaceae bacterium]|nr:hypothetical protein [Herpetosiphonaceae bacterium]